MRFGMACCLETCGFASWVFCGNVLVAIMALFMRVADVGDDIWRWEEAVWMGGVDAGDRKQQPATLLLVG